MSWRTQNSLQLQQQTNTVNYIELRARAHAGLTRDLDSEPHKRWRQAECEACGVRDRLAKDATFIKSPWRRKVKVLIKELQRIKDTYQFVISRNSYSTPEQRESEYRIVNTLFSLIGFAVSRDLPNVRVLLKDSRLTNRMGSWLTKFVRKQNKKSKHHKSNRLFVDDLCYLKNLTIWPVRHNWESASFRSFWQGYEYFNKINNVK
jgi:hypothetical protein